MKKLVVALVLLASATAHARGWYCATVTGTKLVAGKAVAGAWGHCSRTQNACIDGLILEKTNEQYTSEPQASACVAQPVAYAIALRTVGKTVQLELPTLAQCQELAGHGWKTWVVTRQCHEVK